MPLGGAGDFALRFELDKKFVSQDLLLDSGEAKESVFGLFLKLERIGLLVFEAWGNCLSIFTPLPLTRFVNPNEPAADFA